VIALRRGAALVAVAVGAALALGAGPDEDDGPRCHGHTPDIVGTDGDDVLHGTNGRDVIWGGPGDDQIHSALGNDLVCGGPGADLLHSGRGNDTVDGGAGDGDRVIGDLGDDKVMGGAGDRDEVAGSLGIDVVSGGPGDFDLVHGDYGYDRMDGGPGRGDIASFATDVGGGPGADGGVWASLRAGRARGDGHDKLLRFEDLEGSAFDDTLIGTKGANRIHGGPGDDTIRGGGGADLLAGDQGTDRCAGGKAASRRSCGREPALKATAYVELDGTSGGGGGLVLSGGRGRDEFSVAFDSATSTFGVTATTGIALGPGCLRVSAVAASCPANGPARWLTADLGPGPDKLRVEGSLVDVGSVRIAGGPGDDVIRGGPEDDLIESGFGSDRIYGGPGADGLIGGVPGPTLIFGEENGDLMAAGSGCAGGRMVGGPGRDDASFAETGPHPGILYISFPRGRAWIDAVRDCDPVGLDRSNEDMEGSFDNDVLIGNRRPNAMLGQPGRDRFYGGGGDDVIDARDGTRDFFIQCGRRGASPSGRALVDSVDPASAVCEVRKQGVPVPGLNNDN